jgi:hypothetical protein
VCKRYNVVEISLGLNGWKYVMGRGKGKGKGKGNKK